ncbi:MAG: bifunctional riboflavin kinase/FMN adenylyltransferase, partial [Erysipelotrichaceae bacterium]|nr:bifunctional riboflavin kinase/FMN adenylyltransferase [Erysipelotrichaceae bacterium]
VVLLIFDEEMMKTGKEEFIRDYLAPLNIDTLVCGFDFTFGYRGEGNAKTLQESPYRNYELIVEEEVTYYGKKISSTRIREELRKGNLRLVNKLLGYEYGKRTV